MTTDALEVRRAPNLAWVLFAVLLAFYAALAVQSGVHNLPANFEEHHLRLLDEVERQADQGVPYAEVAEAAQQAYPWWNNLMARVTGTYFGFGHNGTTDPTRYYASMQPPQKSVLSVHMMLGGACVMLGVFQFWPYFRRRWRTLHRALGGAYVLATYSMLAASTYHLLHSGVANTYQGFTFHVQLWFLVISTFITQSLALYAIRKRNIAMHLGFQAYTYAAFLSAPLQRYDWMIFGRVYAHLTQGEVNNLVNIMTFWQCLLVAYVIFAWNRAASPRRSAAAAGECPPPATTLRAVVLWGLAAAGVVTTVAFYVYAPGLGAWQAARSIVPAATLAADAALFAGRTLQNLVFAVSIVAAIVAGTWLLVRSENSVVARRTFYIAAIVAGTIQIGWGARLGEPNMAVIAGGGFYCISGLSLVSFACLAAFFGGRDRDGWWREMMVFAVNFAFVPALLLWLHGLWWALDVIPQHYIDVGHGYILAAGGAILTATMNGFFSSFSSRETTSRALG